jgi:hypothetical protein
MGLVHGFMVSFETGELALRGFFGNWAASEFDKINGLNQQKN